MSIPRLMVKDALISAYAGESMAHIRYLYFADVAEKEGFKNVSRLFRAIAIPKGSMPATTSEGLVD